MASEYTRLREPYLQGIHGFSCVPFNAQDPYFADYELPSSTLASGASFSPSSSTSSSSITSYAGRATYWTANGTPSSQTSNSSHSSISTDPADIWTRNSDFSPDGTIYSEPESYGPRLSPTYSMQGDAYACQVEYHVGDVALNVNTTRTKESFSDSSLLFSRGGPTILGIRDHDARKECGKLVCSCGKVFRGRWAPGNWKRHINGIQAPPVCTYCGTTFTRTDNLLSHCREFHSAQDRYKCLICGMKFSTQDAYNEHLETHNQQK